MGMEKSHDRDGSFEPFAASEPAGRFTAFDHGIIALYAHGLTARGRRPIGSVRG
jgi:transposase-like protein